MIIFYSFTEEVYSKHYVLGTVLGYAWDTGMRNFINA